jgi:hypothetical protein
MNTPGGLVDSMRTMAGRSQFACAGDCVRCSGRCASWFGRILSAGGCGCGGDGPGTMRARPT